MANVTIRHKRTGETKVILDRNLGILHIRDNYDLVENNNTPDSSWTVDDIKDYLTDNSIEFTGTHNTKAKLLALINA